MLVINIIFTVLTKIFIRVQMFVNFIFFHISTTLKIIVISQHIHTFRIDIINHKFFFIVIKLYILYNSSYIVDSTYIPLKISDSFVKIIIKNIFVLKLEYRNIRVNGLESINNIIIIYIYHKNNRSIVRKNSKEIFCCFTNNSFHQYF